MRNYMYTINYYKHATVSVAIFNFLVVLMISTNIFREYWNNIFAVQMPFLILNKYRWSTFCNLWETIHETKTRN